MWSEWLARTLKPRPAPDVARPTEAVADERPLATAVPAEDHLADIAEECSVPLHEAALARAAAAARGSL